MEPNVAHLLGRTPSLRRLAEADLRQMAGYTRHLRFVAGEGLVRAGAPAERFLVLLTGTAGEVGGSGPGLPALYEEGDPIGVQAVLEAIPHTASVVALADGQALAVAAAPFLDHLATRFEAMLALLAATSGRLRRTVHEITELKLHSTTRRLAGYLLTLAGAKAEHGEPGAGPLRLVLPCGKHVLAERLGMQPESLSRAFARLRAVGVSTGRDEVVQLADPPALARFCSEAP